MACLKVIMFESFNRTILNAGDGSCDGVKKVPLSSSKKKNNTMCLKEYDDQYRLRSGGIQNEYVRSQIEKMSLLCETRKEAGGAAVHPKLEGDYCCDPDKQFGKDLSSGQGDDCMWLSSDCSSPSSFFNKYKLSGSGNMFLDERLVSWLLKSRNSSVKTSPEDLKEEEVVTWLLSSNKNDFVDSSINCNCIETPESAYRQFTEDFIASENSSDPSSWKSDLDRTCFQVSLLNIDEEDIKWISDTESELDSFQSDFPSPSFKRSVVSECRSSSSSVSSFTELSHENSQYDFSSEHASDAADLENVNSDEPLFWPFERKFDCSELFSMSPRKDLGIFLSSAGTSRKIHGLRYHDRKANLKEESERKYVLSSASSAASKILEHKQRKNKYVIKRTKTTTTTPSRLRNSSKASMKIVPLDMKDDENVISKEKLDWNFLEEELPSKEEVPIESLLGLHEFDGHEGVDLEFNDDVFSLDESL